MEANSKCMEKAKLDISCLLVREFLNIKSRNNNYCKGLVLAKHYRYPLSRCLQGMDSCLALVETI